jgi:NADH-quinone oxidoreductase subunit M
MQRVFYGQKATVNEEHLHDISLREKLILVPMVIVIIALGVYPLPVLYTAKVTLNNILNNKTITPSDASTTKLTQGGNHEQE